MCAINPKRQAQYTLNVYTAEDIPDEEFKRAVGQKVVEAEIELNKDCRQRWHVEEANVLRPMESAPRDATEILVQVRERGGSWLIVHHADGGGEDQPRFRGWFAWGGRAFVQVDPQEFIGWLPLPKACASV